MIVGFSGSCESSPPYPWAPSCAGARSASSLWLACFELPPGSDSYCRFRGARLSLPCECFFCLAVGRFALEAEGVTFGRPSSSSKRR